MNAVEFVSRCREHYPSLPSDDSLTAVCCEMMERGVEAEDKNADFRYAVSQELNRTLSEEDRHFAQYLLEQEIAHHLGLSGGVYESIKLCAYLLFRLGHVEDSLAIWRAKAINFDTHCGVDVQLLVGAGVQETLDWLRRQGSQDAQHAVSWIEGCTATGDFKNPDGYRQFASRYFNDGG